MPTSAHDDTEFVRYSICHIEPVKVVMQDSSQATVELSCVTDDTCGSVHNTCRSTRGQMSGQGNLQAYVCNARRGGEGRTGEGGRAQEDVGECSAVQHH